MTVVLIAAAVACLVWIAVMLRMGWLTRSGLHRVPTLAAVGIWLGSVFGYEFWHLNLGPLPLTIDRVIWGMMALQFGQLLWRGRLRLESLSRMDIVVALLFLTLTISTFAHDFTYRDSMPLSRLLFFNVIPFGLYYVVRQTPLQSGELKTIFAGFALLGCYLAFTAVAEWREIPALVFPGYIISPDYQEFLGRARGPFLNPVVCGTFMTVGLLSMCWFWPRVQSAPVRIVLALWVVVFCLGVFATSTRSVWLAFVFGVGGAAWLLANHRGRGLMIVSAAVAFSGIVLMFGDQLNSFKRDRYVTEAEMSESASLRPLLAQVAFAMFQDRPVLGHGFGQYTKAKRLYHQQATTEPLKKVMPYMQHNVFLSYLTETGLLGTVLLVSMLSLFTVRAWRLSRGPSKEDGRQTVGTIGLALVGCYVINGFFHDVSIMPMIGALFFFFAGLCENLNQREQLVDATRPINDVRDLVYRKAS